MVPGKQCKVPEVTRSRQGEMLLEYVYRSICRGRLPWPQEDQGLNRTLLASEAALVAGGQEIGRTANTAPTQSMR